MTQLRLGFPALIALSLTAALAVAACTQGTTPVCDAGACGTGPASEDAAAAIDSGEAVEPGDAGGG